MLMLKSLKDNRCGHFMFSGYNVFGLHNHHYQNKLRSTKNINKYGCNVCF